jgi:hypothetical protein
VRPNGGVELVAAISDGIVDPNALDEKLAGGNSDPTPFGLRLR